MAENRRDLKINISINIVFGPTPVAVTNDITNQLKTVKIINSAIKNEPVHLPYVAQRPTRILPLSCSRTPLCLIGILQLGGSSCCLRTVYRGRVSNPRYRSAILPGAIATACFRYAPLLFLYWESYADVLLPGSDGYRNEQYDRKIIKEMGELGLLGASIEGYGCAGASTVASGLIAKEVERVDSGYRSGMSVQSSLIMTGIYEFGTQEQKDRLLPELANGNLVGCFGLTEPNHGSDPGSIETVAREHPTKKGQYLLSGAKTWITNSPISDVMLVWAKLESTGKIRGFLVERSKCPPGTLETPAIKNKNGLRASITGMIQMDNCPVPVENMFPDVEGLRGPFTCLNSARLGIAFGTMGALEDSLNRARTYALDRKQFKGNPLAKYQLIQKKLADAATDAAYGTLAATQVARLKDSNKLTPEMISMVKRQNCDRALTNVRAYVSLPDLLLRFVFPQSV
jgi:glutaryl-CoA dehydrogenase